MDTISYAIKFVIMLFIIVIITRLIMAGANFIGNLFRKFIKFILYRVTYPKHYRGMMNNFQNILKKKG